MNLTVGLIQASPAMELLLRQIGIAFREVDLSWAEAEAQYPVLILCGAADSPGRAYLEEHLRRGGAVLCEAHSARACWNIPAAPRRIDYLRAEQDPLLGDLPLIDLPRRGLVARNSRYLPDQDGQATIAEIDQNGGLLIILPEGFIDSVLSRESVRKNFPRSPGGERFPSERVTRVSKAGIRRVLQKCLERLFHLQGLPFVHLSPFPGQANGVFGFRVDTDFSNQEDVKTLHALLHSFQIPATWFVETRSCAGWAGLYSRLTDQEIAFHCYRHRVFDTVEENLKDMHKGLQVLSAVGIQPNGYAAPGGDWNTALATAVERLGFSYASEFSLDYDNLPCFPWLGDRFSRVLQIPVHPVSVGRLGWARHQVEDMITYYQARLSEAQALSEPLFLYHHPGQNRLDVFRDVFETVRALRWQVCSFYDYCRFWKMRLSTRWSASFEQQEIRLAAEDPQTDLCVFISHPDGRRVRQALYSAGKELPAETLPETPPLPPQPDPRQMRRYTRQMLVHELTWRYSRWKQ